MILMISLIGIRDNDFLPCLQVLSQTQLPAHDVQPSPSKILTTISSTALNSMLGPFGPRTDILAFAPIPIAPIQSANKTDLRSPATAAIEPFSQGPCCLRELGYSLQANVKTIEGTKHRDRDAQFRYLNDQVRRFVHRHDPVISVDTKKKELVGSFDNRGRLWGFLNIKGEEAISQIPIFWIVSGLPTVHARTHVCFFRQVKPRAHGMGIEHFGSVGACCGKEITIANDHCGSN
jgi:hypothetical protein